MLAISASHPDVFFAGQLIGFEVMIHPFIP